MVPSRQTAEERRTAVLAAAVSEFARSGYAGTSTESIAARAGISQPYLFRLFGTKKDLFLATYELVADRIIRALTDASDGLEGDDVLSAMGGAYMELMQDPDLLRVQLHGFAAAPSDPELARACRRTFEVLWELVAERSHETDDCIRDFFAMGMMINVMSAIDLLSVPEHWAQSFCPQPEKAEAVRRAGEAVNARQRAEAAEHEEVSA
jgi:AcrR family transcriptional regulator